uniref:Carboxylesterase type B domain-containing protein n=1 Tax=Parascaris univalens TaxID=6257 RepID=A0A915CG86_PARUN
MQNMLSHFIAVLSSVAVVLVNFSAAETDRSTISEDQGGTKRYPIRETTDGRIRGYYLDSNGTTAEIYEAVPYAMPPIGDLRFEPARPPHPWSDIRDCGKGRMQRCVEFWFRGTTAQGTEDCLHMDIVVPTSVSMQNRSLPILIWIHGGSYQVNSATVYPLEAIVENFASRGIIFAAINYRLGPLGFLTASHRLLPGNFGLDDQIQAIRWLKANARNFDGNPELITLGGESAGAASASLLAISPKTKGLFSAVILRSGSALAPWAVRSSSTENNSARLMDFCGCPYNSSLGMVHTLACLKSIPIQRLLNGWHHVAVTVSDFGRESHFMANTYFTPIIDAFRIEESVVPGEPLSIAEENARMPIMLGVTSAESGQLMGRLIAHSNRYTESGEWDLDRVIPPHLYSNYKQVQKATEYQYLDDYPQNLNDNEQRHVLVRITTDQNFKAPAAREAMIYAAKNLPVYAYVFQHENPQLTKRMHSLGIQGAGAVHGNDCTYIFNASKLSDPFLENISWSDEDRKIANRLVDQMVDFVRWRSIKENGFDMYSNLHRVATPISGVEPSGQVEFFTNITQFWHGTVATIEMLHLEPQYRVLLQPCTMCEYPFRVPFYIMLIVLIIVAIASLSVCVHRQRVRQKAAYAIVKKLHAIRADESAKV